MDNRTVLPAEIDRFDALAATWWDPNGPMRPLHRMNPARVGWITARIGDAFGAEARPHILDVGCGAGLVSITLAAAGFPVTGIDAAPGPIAVATERGAALPVPPTHRVATTDDLAAEGAVFDVITALEVIEHVADPALFLATLRTLLRPGGLVVLSTLNRSARSWLTAKLGAEYVLRWLPVGTHDWRRFLPPAELGRLLRGAGLRVSNSAGLTPDPVRGGWRTGRDLGVNYLMAARG